MRRNRAALIFIAPFLAALFLTVFGYGVMRLWNWLMPALFGLHVIGFWQAVGILVLSKILFGGFHGRRGGRMHWRHRMRERWERMTPEQREKLHSVGDRWGSCGSADAAPKV
jgi:hypothetical protein